MNLGKLQENCINICKIDPAELPDKEELVHSVILQVLAVMKDLVEMSSESPAFTDTLSFGTEFIGHLMEEDGVINFERHLEGISLIDHILAYLKMAVEELPREMTDDAELRLQVIADCVGKNLAEIGTFTGNAEEVACSTSSFSDGNMNFPDSSCDLNLLTDVF